MSRDIPGHDVTQIYQISQQWKDDCLLGNNSLFFSDENVWNKDSVGELIVILEEEEISSSKQWRKKLNDQVNNSSNCAKKLAVEVMFVMYLAAWGGSYSKRTFLNHNGQNRFKTFSTCSHSKGELPTTAIQDLRENGISTDGCRSERRDEFVNGSSLVMDVVITVCVNAATDV